MSMGGWFRLCILQYLLDLYRSKLQVDQVPLCKNDDLRLLELKVSSPKEF